MLTEIEKAWLGEISVSVSSQIVGAIKRYVAQKQIPSQNTGKAGTPAKWTKYSSDALQVGETQAFCFVSKLESIRISLNNGVTRKITYFEATTGHFETNYIERKPTQKAIHRLLLEENNSENSALNQIQYLLDGVAWNADTLDNIARVMMQAGYRIRDLEERDRDDLLEDAK